MREEDREEDLVECRVSPGEFMPREVFDRLFPAVPNSWPAVITISLDGSKLYEILADNYFNSLTRGA